MAIEFLSRENIGDLVALFHRGHTASAWSDYPFDPVFLRKNLDDMIGKPEYFACMYRKDGAVIGGWMASLGQFLFSEKLVGMENGIYVDRQHRGGRAALLMYNEFVKWCEKMGAEPFVEIYFSDYADNEKTYNFFRKAGMIECGRIFRSASHGLP